MHKYACFDYTGDEWWKKGGERERERERPRLMNSKYTIHSQQYISDIQNTIDSTTDEINTVIVSSLFSLLWGQTANICCTKSMYTILNEQSKKYQINRLNIGKTFAEILVSFRNVNDHSSII